MDCPNATAPVNIINNTEFICDLKCDYSFKYNKSIIRVANRGEYLSLKTDDSNSPVTYNTNKYDVTEARIYSPSLHSYGGKKADAELIISHQNVSGKERLLVCIPISENGSNETMQIFDKIISETSKTANSVGGKTTVNIPTFSLDMFIPLKPYFSYTGTLPYSPCNGTHDYIVFSKDNNASLGISTISLKNLKEIITKNGYSNKKNKGGVFFNKNGPTMGSSVKGEDIYMECLPTGSEGEQLVPLAQTSTQMFTTESITQYFKSGSTALYILLGIVIILLLLSIGKWIIKKVGSDKVGGEAVPSSIKTGGMKLLKKMKYFTK
jgi:carbonic anhydrase